MLDPSPGRKPQEIRIIISVDLDYFYAQCEEVRKPELRDKPVVICVYSGRTEDSGAVSTANYISRKLGVKAGIPITMAKRILNEHQEAVFLPIDREYYESISDRIMDFLRSEADSFEQISIDEAFLDVTQSCSQQYSRALELGSKIKEKIIRSEGLTCSVGISDNKLISKMASDESKPNGLLLVEPEEVANFLKDMRIGKLPGIGGKTEEKLGLLGIKKIGDLAKFDEEKLADVFGKNLGPHLKMSARGADDSQVHEREAEQLSRIMTLKHDSSSFDFEDDLKKLITDITERLKLSRRMAKSLGIILITNKLKVRSKSHTLKNATDSNEVIFHEICRLFDSFFSESEETIEVRRVGIRVSGLEKSEYSDNQKVVSGSLSDYF